MCFYARVVEFESELLDDWLKLGIELWVDWLVKGPWMIDEWKIEWVWDWLVEEEVLGN